MRLYEDITQLIGHTPLIRLRTGIPTDGPRSYVKLEFYNPTGSLKDRMTYYIIKKALADGRIHPGDTVVDNTSGNTGSAMAMVARHYGLRAVVTTPDKTSKEKVDLMRSYGAEVIITPETVKHDDPRGFWAVARKLAREKGYFDLDQYDSQDNVDSHYMTTGPEIWEDTDGKVTHFIAGIGTGGTFSGAARYLKEQNPDIKTIAVDPEGSVFTEYIQNHREIVGKTYMVEGIGSDVITEALHPELVDSVITVSDADSFNRARLIAKEEGISSGGSSGSVAFAMEQVAANLGNDSFLVGIFGDSGIRYLSKCYNDDWMREHNYSLNTQQPETL
ncbi:MAG: cysteine synthase family protein [candidate division Zixibacteria bacterium]|nr:cysteine synthase family protein [candidate division Zixibacteria bacterium]